MQALLRLFSLLISFEIPRKLKEIDKHGKVVCVYGHNPTREAFDSLVKWFLKNNFNFITTEGLIDVINKKYKVKRPVWLSFDDGWRDNFSNILPVLEKYKIPGIFFISTRPIETGTFWWTKIQRNKHRLDHKIIIHPWEISNKWRKKQLEQILENGIKREALTIKELQSLSKSKYVTIGNHTDDHVNCITCNRIELIEEINIANNKIMNWTGIPVKYFAYPGGYRNSEIISILKKLDFKLAASTESRFATPTDDQFDLPRNCIKNKPVSLTENITMALGIRQKYICFFKTLYDKLDPSPL